MTDNQLLLFDQEIWRWVVGYKGHYKVSNFGRVMSVKFGRNKILKQQIVKEYHTVTLCKDGHRKGIGVHILMAYAFLGPCPGRHGIQKGDWQVDHFDENKDNNHLSNLRWLLGIENTQRARKLTKAQVIAIRADTRKIKVIAREYNVCTKVIWSVKKRRSWANI